MTLPVRVSVPRQFAARISWRALLFGTALLYGASSPTTLSAQRTPVRDSAAVRRAPDGLVLDFVEQDVSVVLRAIAEAGGLSVTLSNMPSALVTLRLQQPASRDAALDALRAVAEGHGIALTEGSAVIRLVGPPRTPATPPRAQPRELNLYTVRLRHTTAAAIAPLLMNVLTGTGSTGGPSRGSGSPIGRIQDVQRGPGGVAPSPAQPPTNIPSPNAFVIRDANGVVMGQQLTGGGGAGAFTDIRIVADDATNSLVVRATDEDFAAVQQLIASLDLRPLQVLIEVTIAQVERSGDLSLGVSGTATRREGANAGDTLGRLPGSGTARDFVAMLTGGRGTVDFDLAINALQTRGNVRLLALPVIIAQNNREATLNVGSSVPFVQVSQQGGFDPLARVQTVQYLPVGKQLTILPTINADGYVNMEVVQTNDDVTNNLLFDAPIINQRQAQTSVFVRNGQTTVIGGLSDNSTEESSAGVPFLSRLPLIGWLFGNTRRSTRTTELFLFLTPHIVSSDEDVDRLRESVRSANPSLRDVPVEGRVIPRPDSVRPRTPVPPDSVAFDGHPFRVSTPVR
jgi:type II secretory pathway component GspD/PulD (secretin)